MGKVFGYGRGDSRSAPPRTNMTFNPNDHVTRADMAQHLHQFLTLATPGPGAFGGEADEDKYENVTIDDNPFTDINNETKNAYDAILHIYELGITEGQTHTTYNPTSPVTRAQMASFITRTMDHTNTRPQGLTIQGVPPGTFVGDTGLSAWISLRDTKFLPIEAALVDSFYYVVDEDNAPFVDEGDDEGKCRIDNPDTTDTNEGPVEGGCTLDGDITEEGGNVEWLLAGVSDEAGDVMVYFWTGDEGEFDLDESEHQSYAITVSKAAAALKIETTHGMEGSLAGDDGIFGNSDDPDYDGVYAEYGETVTVTIQLVDKINTDGTAADDNANPVAKPGVELTVAIYKNDGDGTTENSTMTRPTDDDGKIQLTFTKNDPKPDDDGNIGTVIVTVTDPYTSNAPPTIVRTIQWSDADAEATTIKLSSTRPYVKLPDAGKSARVTISSRVYDQYGDQDKQAVTLVSSAGGRHPENTARSLGFHVTYMVEPNDTGAAQRFGAWFGDASNPQGTDISGTDNSITVSDTSSDDGQTVYWAVKNDDLAATPIVHVDEAEKTIVVSSGADNASYAVYNSDDQFFIGTGPVLMSKFEEELGGTVGTNRTIVWTVRDGGVSTFTLSAT